MISLPVLPSPEPQAGHASRAAAFVADAERTTWHDETLWQVRRKRDAAAAAVPAWEALRERASQIKAHTLAHLDTYLERFEARAAAHGVTVHWARDADEHNRIVHGLLAARGVRRLVKSKSMLTEECGLNTFLEARGLEVVDTDLGERIVQLAEEPPSHIVMPAIHKKREEIGRLFHEHMGTRQGATDAQYLTEAARSHLRERFLGAEAAVTGVNFAVAETGGLVVCTNEGNADLGAHTAPLHVACMGLEKLIPRAEDLGVFLRLLARSATGQPLTVYTSHFHRPRQGAELHVVLVDNGRSERLGRPAFRDALKCIRCGACMNTCPVYRRSGGHSYGYTVPGPIGAILAPSTDLEAHSTLPFASTLCGSCSDVCPVKIPIHEQLYAWRQEIMGGQPDRAKATAMRLAGGLVARPRLYRLVGRLARALARRLPHRLRSGPLGAWTRARDLPDPPRQSFRDWYTQR